MAQWLSKRSPLTSGRRGGLRLRAKAESVRIMYMTLVRAVPVGPGQLVGSGRLMMRSQAAIAAEPEPF